ncbi:MAG TPA: outer membrane beta-barrel protein, partial [Bacteroidia bacterium]|nr:outer membrane beta-barrel protein [Bacteroidia bacterium]
MANDTVMWKKINLLTFSLLACSVVFGQPNGSVDLKIANDQQKPVEGVFAQLVKSKDSSMTQYAVSGQNGDIKFSNVPKGKYLVYVTQTGFEDYYSSVFQIDSTHLQVKLPDIALKSKSLKEVTIVSKTPVIQHFADKTVVNVQESVLAAAGSVFDVLQRSPGVMVDQNDNISLHGKANVMVMIDGRITPMSSTDLANMLRGMPAETVEKIEFITNPGAKYDANGTAGIINIVLKKDKRMGTNATVLAGYGQGIYPRTNDGFSFNDRTKKFNIFSSYNYSYRGSTNILTARTNFYNANNDYTGGTMQYEYLKVPTISNTARVGADFFASDKTTIGFIADGSISGFNPSESTTTYVYDSLNNTKSYNTTSSYSPNSTYNYAGNLNMKHTFDSLGRELLINVDYANYRNIASQAIKTFYYNVDNTEAGSPTSLYGSLPGMLDIYSFKADYDGQLGSKGTLQAGVKSSYVKTNNSVNFYDGASSSAPVDTTQTNHFIYSENINAGYITYSRNIPKASVQVGLRAEQTVANGNQVTTGQEFSRNYIQFFPNLSINDSLTKDHQLDLSVTRRIDRPTYQQLNPFSLYINPTFYLQGNPYLVPQSAYSFQLSDTYKEQYTLSFTYTHTDKPIITVILPIPGRQNIIQQTDDNLGSSDYYGVNATVARPITPWYTTTTFADVFYNHFNANISGSPLNSTRFLWDMNTDNIFTVSKKFTVDINLYYSSGYDLGYLFIKAQSS